MFLKYLGGYMFQFIKKSAICVVCLTIISCGSNPKVVSYNDGKKTVSVNADQVIKDIGQLAPTMAPQDIQFLDQNRDILKKGIAAASIDRNLYIMDALDISNFIEDPAYQQEIESLKQQMPYRFAFNKGREDVVKKIEDQKIEIAEVYQIMFTNDLAGKVIDTTNASMTIEQILEQLQASTNVIEEFTVLASQYSQEPIGMQTGGYLGYIQKGRRADIDEVVFSKKIKGLYTEIIQGDFGTYIIYVTEPAKKMTIRDARMKNIYVDENAVLNDYLLSNIEVLYTLDGDNVIIGKKVTPIAEFSLDTKIVKLWNKKYSLAELKNALEAAGMIFSASNDQGPMLRMLINDDNTPSQQLNYLAVALKDYKSSITSDSEYKKEFDNELYGIKFQKAVGILSAEIFKDFSTNVTEQELKEAYADTNNRPVVDYKANDEPVYATYFKAKEQLKQLILEKRALAIQEAYQDKLSEKYNVIWSDKGIDAVMQKMKKKYGYQEDEIIEEEVIVEEPMETE